MTNDISTTYPFLSVPTAIDYTSKDYTGLTASMLTYAVAAFPDWNPTSEGDFGVILIELFAYMGDIISYYGDRITQEAYLPTATQRLSILNIAATLGYVPSNGTPASGTVTFATDTAGPPVTVPALTQVQTSFSVTDDITGNVAPAIYETQADLVVPGDGGSATVATIQGVTTVTQSIGVSTGYPGQQFTLSQIGVQDGTTQIFVQDANDPGITQWFEVAFLVDAGPQGENYSVTTESDGSTVINFGDDNNGLIPPLGMQIWCTYRVIIGAGGNVPAGSITTILEPITGVSIPFLADGVTYDSSAQNGGSDPEDNDTIRANAPAAYRAQYRAVSEEDFSDLALNVPGVLMAQAVAGNNTSVSLYVLGPNYQPPGPQLVDNILDYFDGKTLAGVSLSVVNPDIVPVDVGSSTSPVQLVVNNKYSSPVVQAALNAAWQAFLSPPNVSFGQLINLSDLYGVADGIAGIQWVQIPVFTREDVTQTGTTSIQFLSSEVPSAGTNYFNTTGGLGS